MSGLAHRYVPLSQHDGLGRGEPDSELRCTFQIKVRASMVIVLPMHAGHKAQMAR